MKRVIAIFFSDLFLQHSHSQYKDDFRVTFLHQFSHLKLKLLAKVKFQQEFAISMDFWSNQVDFYEIKPQNTGLSTLGY